VASFTPRLTYYRRKSARFRLGGTQSQSGSLEEKIPDPSGTNNKICKYGGKGGHERVSCHSAGFTILSLAGLIRSSNGGTEKNTEVGIRDTASYLNTRGDPLESPPRLSWLRLFMVSLSCSLRILIISSSYTTVSLQMLSNSSFSHPTVRCCVARKRSLNKIKIGNTSFRCHLGTSF
jgi:hypothetical protein